MALTRNRLVLAKIETTYGTDSTPTGVSNAMLTSTDVTCDANVGNRLERNNIDGSMGSNGVIVDALYATISFSMELAGAGAAGTAPAYGCLLRACGLSETINVATDVQYDPVSTGHESVTIYYYEGDTLMKLTGARGSVSFSLNANAIPSMSFNFTGLRNAPSSSSLPSGTFTSFQTPLAVSNANTGTLTLHGYAAVTETVTVDFGANVAYSNLINQEQVNYMDRQVSGSMNVKRPDFGTKDYDAIIAAGTEGAIQAIHGTTAGNIVQFDASYVQITGSSTSDITGEIGKNYSLRLNKSSGDDEFKLTVK